MCKIRFGDRSDWERYELMRICILWSGKFQPRKKVFCPTANLFGINYPVYSKGRLSKYLTPQCLNLLPSWKYIPHWMVSIFIHPMVMGFVNAEHRNFKWNEKCHTNFNQQLNKLSGNPSRFFSTMQHIQTSSAIPSSAALLICRFLECVFMVTKCIGRITLSDQPKNTNYGHSLN